MAGYVLDEAVIVLDDGRQLLGGEPFRLLRLSSDGAAAFWQLLAPNGSCDPSNALAGRLESAGIVHPVGRAADVSPADITVVVPVRAPALDLGLLAAKLMGADPPFCDVVLVDDASPDGGESTVAVALATGASTVLRPANGGPGVARNSARPRSEFVAYLDADTVIEDPVAVITACAGHFGDKEVALVAPRVVSVSSPGRIGGYEVFESPLDLGSRPGLVGPKRRLSYLPAAALVARRSALEAVGGFDEALRYGEDVDLVRRLVAAGWKVRYEPAVTVGHRPRSKVLGFVRQRYSYGSSAAEIDSRHPGTVAPFVASPSAATAVAFVVCGALSRRLRRGLAIGLAGPATMSVVSTARVARALSSAGTPSPRRLAIRLSSKSLGGSLSGAADALRRTWWPLALPLLASRGRRRQVAVLLAGASVAGHLRQAARSTQPLAHLVIGLVDDLSYGAGVFAGCIRAKSLHAIAPQLSRAQRAPRAR